ncbi:helix-turn-helix domain-containing protein [Planococcus sp. SE5232]|uniref:helix-turn-helix domain-containing protein n=1 Tax=unclassified Planococcus (in: firmicutes) TaxID=2662419 RepID=UPI003D6A381A
MYTLKQMHRKEAAQNIDRFIIETLVSKIRAYRIFFNISQRELSRKSGVTQNIISRMESGIAVPQLQTLIKLLDALELDIEINVKPREKEEDFLESINQDKLKDMRQKTLEVINNNFQEMK